MCNPRSCRLALPRFLGLVLGVATTWAAGCGDGPDVVPVSGRITLDSNPLAGAYVTTQPIGTVENPNPGEGSFGETDEDGRYHLELASDGTPGAVVGEHRVTVVMKDDAFSANPSSDLPQPVSRPWPQHFTDNSLRITVPSGGTESADLELSMNPR
jgi:hypothetical protein